MLIGLLLALAACRTKPIVGSAAANIESFNFQVAVGQNNYQIEGYLALDQASHGQELPALLVLDGPDGSAKRCIAANSHLTGLGMQIACISIPGYGKSSGPSRFVGKQAVAAARRALDLLAARTDVDSNRLAIWGLSNGAVAAGLVMDADPRLRAVVLESGAYDMARFWPEATWMTKLAILREVWPSPRILRERSVLANMPPKLDCRVLILHGDNDKKMPVDQAKLLEQALRERGAKVEARYFAQGPHFLGSRVDVPVQDFLKENLIASN
ncbi:MAG TPA: prolyl oligopeptidase family serine peptidase [Candidatus Binataceae bacterium]